MQPRKKNTSFSLRRRIKDLKTKSKKSKHKKLLEEKKRLFQYKGERIPGNRGLAPYNPPERQKDKRKRTNRTRRKDLRVRHPFNVPIIPLLVIPERFYQESELYPYHPQKQKTDSLRRKIKN